MRPRRVPRELSEFMKLRLVALSHRMPAWVTAGFTEYAKRLPRDCALELRELKPAARDRGVAPQQLLASEAERIKSACDGYRVIALDERGLPWTTVELASRLARHRDAGDALAFVIGSADGLHDSVKRSAAALVALSALTLPHGLVRVLLAEQLYRAFSLTAGHPYHRA
jgi:23S rRNA (pseudouridine1915-N3)-methyltransferase